MSKPDPKKEIGLTREDFIALLLDAGFLKKGNCDWEFSYSVTIRIERLEKEKTP